MTRRLPEGPAAERRQRRRECLSDMELPAVVEEYRSLPGREGKRTLLTKAALVDLIVAVEEDTLEGRHGREARAALLRRRGEAA